MTSELSKRYYELDWLRVFAISTLVIYHVGMYFNDWGWHIKAPETTDMSIWMSPLSAFRMPLLFTIAGASSFMVINKYSSKYFVKQRFWRLGVPFVLGFLTIISPPQIYYERLAQGYEFASYWEFYKTVFEFGSHGEGGSIAWCHLWFILYLIFYSIASLPLLTIINSWVNEGKYSHYLDNIFNAKTLVFWFIPIVISDILLNEHWEYKHSLIVDDWACTMHYWFFFLFGYIAFAKKKIWESIKLNRRMFLLLAITIYAFDTTFDFAFDNQNDRINYIKYNIVTPAFAWVMILGCIGYAKKYLTNTNTFLKYAAPACYPFYILHQTVIVLVAVNTIQYFDGVWIPFIVIFLLSYFGSVLIYELFIRRWNFMRFCFGMRPLSSK